MRSVLAEGGFLAAPRPTGVARRLPIHCSTEVRVMVSTGSGPKVGMMRSRRICRYLRIVPGVADAVRASRWALAALASVGTLAPRRRRRP